MDLTDYYQIIFDSSREVMHQSFEKISSLAEIHSFAEDLLIWCDVLPDKDSAYLLRLAVQELQISTYALIQGLYRQSFGSLRLSLELSLGSVLFANEKLKFQEWKLGSKDLVWSELIDKDNGILSKRCATAFFPEITEYVSRYNSLAKSAYRNLSEFVHGNQQTWSLYEEVIIDFNEVLYDRWMENFNKLNKAISFALCLRFLKYIDNPAHTNKVESHLLECLGHIMEIRTFFGGPVES